ncbi:MAG: hypothetical protein EOM87_08785, partial [Clostridia bacterium]|nr:hypothetical protein [Clostridia bacterium]
MKKYELQESLKYDDFCELHESINKMKTERLDESKKAINVNCIFLTSFKSANDLNNSMKLFKEGFEKEGVSFIPINVKTCYVHSTGKGYAQITDKATGLDQEFNATNTIIIPRRAVLYNTHT